MGYDLIAGILAVALTPFVLLGFAVFWMVNARDHEEHSASFAAYAGARGLHFAPPEGAWPNRTSAAVTWKHESASMRFSVIGRESKTKTRLTIRPRNALLGTLVASANESRTELRTTARPAGFAKRVLTPEITRALLGFSQRDKVVLTYRRGRFLLEWPGRELNDARLDAARVVGEAIVRAVDEEFASVASVRAA